MSGRAAKLFQVSSDEFHSFRPGVGDLTGIRVPVPRLSPDGCVPKLPRHVHALCEVRLLSGQDVAMLQDLIVAAFNDANAKANDILARKLGGLGAGIKMPGMG